MTETFGAVLDSRLDTVTLTDIAERMAGEGGKPRNVLSTLSRFRNSDRKPSRRKVWEIADALASARGFSEAETESLRADLLRAAGYDDPRFSDLQTAAKLELSEAETRRHLHPRCEQVLRENGYSQIQTRRIMDAIGVSTMRLIIKAHKEGEKIEVVELGKLGAVNQLATEEPTEEKTATGGGSETVVEAGRARITVKGELSPEQEKVLNMAAGMIEAVLKI